MNSKQMNTIPKTPFSFFQKINKPYRWAGGLCFLLVTLSQSLNMLATYFTQPLIDSLIANNTDIWKNALIFMFFFITNQIFWRSSGFVGMRWITNIRTKSLNVLHQNLLGHSHRFFSSNFAGSLVSSVGHVAYGLDRVLPLVLWTLYPVFIRIIASFVIAWGVHPYVAGGMGLWLGVFFVLNLLVLPKKFKASNENASAHSRLRGTAIDIIGNVFAVHLFAKEQDEQKRIEAATEHLWHTGIRSWTIGEWILIMNNILQVALVGFGLWGAIYLRQMGLITVGQITMLLLILWDLVDALLFLGQNLNRLTELRGEIQNGLRKLSQEHEVVDAKNAKPLVIKKGEIMIRNVDFVYPDQPEGPKVFENLNINIKAGEKVGLVGHSGQGKSTLIKLLLRQYDVTDGKITIDGQNIAAVTTKSLREGISFVPQDTQLFHRTIKENITYANPKISEEAMKKAANDAEVAEFIDNLEQKYDTLVGERGVRLSGGQRQRIAIARAMIKASPILILDEATSSLDSEAENKIQKALKSLMQDKTVIAIAHRLSTLQGMDRILVFEGGKVAESGTHDELLNQKGIYASLWESQVGGFIVE